MTHTAARTFIAFLRNPAVWPGVLSIALVVTLFLQLFATAWEPRRGVVGYMYLFVQGFFWFCVALGLALLMPFAFSEIGSRLKRAESLTILRIGPTTAGTTRQ